MSRNEGNVPQDDDATRKQDAEALLSRMESLFPEIPAVTATDLNNLHEQHTQGDISLLLIDVREAEEQATSTLRDALPPAAAEEKLATMDEHRAHVVCFCTVGARSGAYARKLQHRFAGAHVLNYSVLRHVWAGGELVAHQGDSATCSRVHVFSSSYRHLVPGTVQPVQFPTHVAIWRALRAAPDLIGALLTSPAR